MIDARLCTKTVARVSERINRSRYAELARKISNVSYDSPVRITRLMDLFRFLREPRRY